MKKRSRLLLNMLVVLVVFVLAGCSSAGNSSTGENESQNSTDSEIENQTPSENGTEDGSENTGSTEQETESEPDNSEKDTETGAEPDNAEDEKPVTPDRSEDTGENDTQKEETSEKEENAEPEYTYKKLDKTMYAKDSVNVRDMPSSSGKKLGKLSKDDAVKVTGQCNETGWYRIEYNSGTGYVSSSYLTGTAPVSDNEEDSANSKYTFKKLDKEFYVKDDVDVMDIPEKTGKSLGQVKNAQVVHVTGQCNETGWYRIKFMHTEGYVPSDYLLLEVTPEGEYPEAIKKALDAGYYKLVTFMDYKGGTGYSLMVPAELNNIYKNWCIGMGRTGTLSGDILDLLLTEIDLNYDFSTGTYTGENDENNHIMVSSFNLSEPWADKEAYMGVRIKKLKMFLDYHYDEELAAFVKQFDYVPEYPWEI